MYRTLKKLLLCAALVPLLFVATANVGQAAPRHHGRYYGHNRYWNNYWGWYGRSYRPYWNGYSRRYGYGYPTYGYYGNRYYGYGYPYYGNSVGVRIGPLSIGGFWY